jgi:hypothetical protein
MPPFESTSKDAVEGFSGCAAVLCIAFKIREPLLLHNETARIEKIIEESANFASRMFLSSSTSLVPFVRQQNQMTVRTSLCFITF